LLLPAEAASKTLCGIILAESSACWLLTVLLTYILTKYRLLCIIALTSKERGRLLILLLLILTKTSKS